MSELDVPASIQGTTAEDSTDLVRLEGVISKGFVEVGAALTEIRKRKLFRSVGFSSFDRYVEDRWGLGHSSAYRQMDAYRVVHALASPNGDIPSYSVLPQSESVARELALVKKQDDVRELWRVVIELHGERPSAAQVADIRVVWRAAVEQLGRYPDAVELESARAEAARVAETAERARLEQEAAAAREKEQRKQLEIEQRKQRELDYLERKRREEAEGSGEDGSAEPLNGTVRTPAEMAVRKGDKELAVGYFRGFTSQASLIENLKQELPVFKAWYVSNYRQLESDNGVLTRRLEEANQRVRDLEDKPSEQSSSDDEEYEDVIPGY